MKLLIGYDGSECADAALDDLKRAGLPDKTEAFVLTAADVFVPPPINEEIDNSFPFYIPDGIRRAHEHAAMAVKEAGILAERAHARIKSSFPGWDVRVEAVADSPAWAIIKKADEWKPDLLVIGAQGHAVMGGRLILGSVSQRVLYEAHCSVRIARGPGTIDDSPVRIVVGADGSPYAGAAIDAIARRTWPAGSEVRILSVLDTVMCVKPDPSQPSIARWVEVGNEENWKWIKALFEPLVEKLRRAGLIATVITKKGNPKQTIVEDAKEWGADSIFLGAKGMRGVDRLLLGSVSAAVAAHAGCSVEIVRSPAANDGDEM